MGVRLFTSTASSFARRASSRISNKEICSRVAPAEGAPALMRGFAATGIVEGAVDRAGADADESA
jgi:hypothetical protein